MTQRTRLGNRIVRMPEMADALGRSTKTVHRMELRGDIPRQVRGLNDRRLGWRESDVVALLAAKPK